MMECNNKRCMSPHFAVPQLVGVNADLSEMTPKSKAFTGNMHQTRCGRWPIAPYELTDDK